MDRSNHYEAAFEAYLQAHRLGYVAVDETRRALYGDLRVKSLDFIVCGAEGARLLVDIKGRRFPQGPPERPRRIWESWSTHDDIAGLEQWKALFGPGYQGVLVFIYHVLQQVILPDDVEDLWPWRGRRYLLRAVTAADYRRHMRIRSPKWGTVGLSGSVFRELAQPFCRFLRGQAVAETCPF
jgi:hypothetical protein